MVIVGIDELHDQIFFAFIEADSLYHAATEPFASEICEIYLTAIFDINIFCISI